MTTDLLLLGLDVGTTACKATVMTPDGDEVAHGRAPMPWRTVPTGAEIDPDALLRCALQAGDEALTKAPDGRIAGVGVSSMAETGVLVDREGRPVTDAIAWHDSRGEAEAARLAADLGPSFSERTGLPASPLCTLVKYRWLKDHRPEPTERGVRWLNVAEWVVHGLGGGEPQAELSLASRTGMLDLLTRKPYDEALAWAGAPTTILPQPETAGTPAGSVITTALPRAQGATLAIGGHDHLSTAVGAGCTSPGDVLDSCGTAEAFVRTVEPFPPHSISAAVQSGFTVCWHAVEGRQALQGATASGAMLQRILDLLGVPARDRDELERAALTEEPGDLKVQGLGLTDDRIGLTGIGPGVSPARVWRAALEAAGAAGADVLARMAEIAGPAKRLMATGGWAQGVATQAVKEQHLGPFRHVPAIYAGARGAAIAAGRATGLWNDKEDH